MGATFEKGAEFSGITLDGKVNFENATFKGYSNFEKSTFRGDASFRGTTFEGDVSFKETTLKCDACFGWVIFRKRVNFQGTIFKGYYTDFIRAIFEGDAYFNGATFDVNVFFWSDWDEEYLDGKYKFSGKLEFSNLNFRSIYIDIPSKYFKLPEAEAEACRVQRICYEKEGNKDKADKMFVQERRALRRARVRQAKELLSKSRDIKSKLKAIVNLLKSYGSFFMEVLLADLTCKYGTSWMRPILLWVLVVFGFSILYYIGKGVTSAKTFWEYLYFSMTVGTTLGFEKYHPNPNITLVDITVGLLPFKIPVYQILVGFEAMFGMFMWATFLTVFARKYMR